MTKTRNKRGNSIDLFHQTSKLRAKYYHKQEKIIKQKAERGKAEILNQFKMTEEDEDGNPTLRSLIYVCSPDKMKIRRNKNKKG